jgi:hypothetical protein
MGQLEKRLKIGVNNSKVATLQIEKFIAICQFVRQRDLKNAILIQFSMIQDGKMQA